MKRHLHILWLIMAFSLLFAGCVVPAAPAAEAPPAESEAVAETAGPSGDVLWWALAEFDIESHIDDLVAAYKEHSPNVNLQVELLPAGSYFERYLPALASGEGPDVFVNTVPSGSLETATLELNPFIEGPTGFDLEETFDVDALRGRMVEDKVYGLPRSLHGGHGWFINLDLFEQFGAEPPAEGWTWSDMLALAPPGHRQGEPHLRPRHRCPRHHGNRLPTSF